MNSRLVLPSEMPWEKIKGPDLEELLYWLFDSMGAKDLEWRVGGKGGGAPDQGRDLELSFFTPSPDGALSKQVWWVEAKGRKGTVEASEVHKAVLNAAGKQHVEVLVVATNTAFSNPTRDWVKEWQRDHPRPIVKLWEKIELENLCSRNPLAVIRLHSGALSPQGRVEVVSSKLWDYAAFSDEPTLKSIWKSRSEVNIEERALFALVASECANGEIGSRSWAATASNSTLYSTLCNGLLNFLFLTFRSNEMGARQEPLIKAVSYLILIAVYRLGGESVTSLLSEVWEEVEGREYPKHVQKLILDPVLATLQAELKDVCSRDCRRMLTDLETLQEDEAEGYWDRLSISEEGNEKDERILTIINIKEPCKIGLVEGDDGECPFFDNESPHESLSDFIQTVGGVIQERYKGSGSGE